MDSSSGNAHARFRLDRAEPWQQEAAQRQMEAQRVQREALQKQIAEKQARSGDGSRPQRFSPQADRQTGCHPPPAIHGNRALSPVELLSDRELELARSRPAIAHASMPGQSRQDQDARNWGQPQNSDVEEEGYGPGALPPHGSRQHNSHPHWQQDDRNEGCYPEAAPPPQQKYMQQYSQDDEGRFASDRPQHVQHHQSSLYQDNPAWGDTGTSFDQAGRHNAVGDAAHAYQSGASSKSPDEGIDSASFQEILGMMRELKQHHAEMRSQLDETIRAKQQITADSKVHRRKVPQNHPVGGIGRSPPRKVTAKPVHGRRARTAQSAAVIGADGTVGNLPSNRHRRPVTEQHSRPRPRADVQDDIEILMAYYSEYDPKLATPEKVNVIIDKFRGGKHGGQWRDAMYARIGEKRGVNPRDLFRDRRKQQQRNPKGIDVNRQSEEQTVEAGVSDSFDVDDESISATGHSRRPPLLQLSGAPQACVYGTTDANSIDQQRERELELDCQARVGPHGPSKIHQSEPASLDRRKGESTVSMEVPGLGGMSAVIATGPQARQPPTPRTLAARMGHRRRSNYVQVANERAHSPAAFDWQEAAAPPPQQIISEAGRPAPAPAKVSAEQALPQHQHHLTHSTGSYRATLEPRPYATYQDFDDEHSHSPPITHVNSPVAAQDPPSPAAQHTRYKSFHMHPEEQTEVERKLALQAAQRAEWDEQVRQRERNMPRSNTMPSETRQAPHHRVVPPRRW